MDQNRIVELALESLAQQKTQIEGQINELRAQLDGRAGSAGQARSEKTKAYWAAKRTTAGSLPPPARKRRPKTAAEKKALSLAMKRAWAKRKAAAKNK